jgi:hypothetical protein
MSTGHLLLHLLDIKCFHLICLFVCLSRQYTTSESHALYCNLGAKKYKRIRIGTILSMCLSLLSIAGNAAAAWSGIESALWLSGKACTSHTIVDLPEWFRGWT